MRYTREVSEAIEQGRPVVALESTLIAHGLPRPENVDIARMIEGVVREVKIEGLLAEVELDVTRGARLVAVITRESAESLGLAPGMSAKAVVKATSVMVER